MSKDLQQQVQDAIDDLVASGAERGLQVAVYHRGELVVDAVAGVADPATGRPVASDTPFFSFSVGKGLAATALHVLAERGLVEYDMPIVALWPEFGAHGKERATVRHVLSQSAGVPGLPAGLTVQDLCDWEKMTAIVAGAEPWWEPGTKLGYHAVTWGYLVGEIVRRVTGKRISQVLREEVAIPLGVADELYLAVPPARQSWLARLEDTGDPEGIFGEMPPDAPARKLGPAECTTAAYGNRADVLAADIPAGGTVTARGVARMYAALLGDVPGVRLISPERLREISAVAMSGIDEVFGFPTSWGLGYAIDEFIAKSGTAFGVGGIGGSHAFADTATGVSFALTKNRLTPTFDAAGRVAGIVTEALGVGRKAIGVRR